MKEIWDLRNFVTLEQVKKKIEFIKEYHNRDVKYAFFDERLINNIRKDSQRDVFNINKILGIERVKLMRG